MARVRTSGNGRLEETMANLAQAQMVLVQSHATLEQAMATLLQNQAAYAAEKRETDRSSAERFARIEAILMEHSRILKDLTDDSRYVRDQMGHLGFRPPERQEP